MPVQQRGITGLYPCQHAHLKSRFGWHHAAQSCPLVVAEQFGTLATLYPNRVELGLGRAPGTDQVTMRALRRGRQETEDQFPQDVLEILQYFKEPAPHQRIVATPGQNTHVPVWLLV